MRKLKRQVARTRMKKQGYAGINKKKAVQTRTINGAVQKYNGKSFFAENWKEFLKKKK